MELEVEIPDYLKHFEDENKGRTASKVSKIATMFQCPSENEEKDERDGPGSATVVRTESHVARFNTARALFEKMAEKKEESKANKGFNQRRQFSSLQSSRSIPSSCGKSHSRSPSPPVPHPSHQSNGHHCSSCKSNLSSVSTIASISYTSTTPTFHSSAQNPSVPSVLPFKARSSSFDSEALKGKWHNTIPGAETSKSNYSEQLRCKNEFAKNQNDERLVKPQEICCSNNRVYHTSTLPAKIEDANRDFNRKYEQSLVKAMENKSKPSLLSKPEKPAKPETLIDKPLSSHLQNQQIIQRHKNWFQSFSKIKSPVTSPQKHHQQSSNSQPTCNVLEQRRHSEDPAAIHNDWRRERSAILKGPGRSGHQDVEEKDGKASVDIANVKNFENASTLPSCWSPPQQYNECSSNKSDISSSSYQDTHPLPSSSSSSSANEESKRSSSKGERAVEGKTYIITDISKDTRISNVEKKNVLASQIDMKNVGVFKKESQYEKSSSSLPQEGERRNRDHHPQDSSHSEEETVSKSSIVLRQRPDISRDKEKRLKEWEKRLSQREAAFYSAHDGSVERHTNRDSFSSKFDGKYLPEPIYDKRESIKTVKEPKEYYHEDYLHRTYKTVEKEGRHTEKTEKEEDEKEKKKLLQIEREKVLREERRSHEIDKNIVYSEDQAKLWGKEGNEECSEIYEKKNDKQAQYPRKDKDENLESFLGKRNIAETALKIEKVDERLRIEEKREKPRRDEREREKMRREFEERERLLRDAEQQDKLMREEGEHKRPRTKEEEELERLRRHKIERERIKREEEHEKKRRLKDDRERVRGESGEKERSLLEEDRDKVRKEEKERNKMKREKEEWMRIKREMEEKERLKKGDKEFEKLTRAEEEEELERQRKEMKELERLKREEEERVKLKRKELEKLRREEEERERLKKEEEEKRRLRREIEMEKFRKEEEENERLRREVEEKEKLRREEEARERIKKEEERMKIEEERLRKEVEERLRKEEEERIWREEQEKRKRDEEERLRKEEEERLRREKEEKLRREEEERLRKEEERLRREEEERLRKAEKERLRREEKEKLKREEEEKLRKEEEERLRREEEMRLRRKEEERLRRKEEERLRKEDEEKLRREQEERLRREEEEKLRREKEERLKREEKERLRREEEERFRREEEERFRREEEERFRREEEERIRREEEERLRREEEERLKREEEERLRKEKEEILRREKEERLRREKEERLRREEEERLRREEEEKLKKEEEEKLRREEEERLKREEEERLMREEEEKLRREEEEKIREEEEKMRREEERLQREEEERVRRKEQEENIRKVEEERLQKEKMEKEKLSRVDHGWAIVKGEHKEIISLREEKSLGSSDVIDETNREIKSLANKEKNIQKHGTECFDSSNVVETKVIISHKGEFERRWQAKREQLEEEERLRREKDRLEIEKTKRRIAELKRERDEIQRQQAIRLRMLMKGDNVEESQIDYDEMFPASRKDDEVGSSSQNGEENFNQIQDFATSTPVTENIKIENTISSYSEAATVKETEAFQVHNTFYENKSTSSTQLDEDSLEEVTYDHTVQSAQHKIEFCTGSYHESISKDVHNSSPTSNFEPFPSSTMSSDFEPLPPPVPPHNVDPAILTANHIIEQTPLPPIPQQTLEVTSELPEPMTPEEAEKLLSHNIIETKKSLISEALEADSSRELNTSDVCDPKSNLPEESVIRSKDDDDDDGFDKDYDSVCVESPTPDNEVDLDDSFSSFKHEVNDEGFVVRAKEVLSEDGIHYLEDGHFWIQVPGLMEEDEDDIPDTVPFHKHTKLKFSQDPIKLYSTFSVTDYDRRNDEVDPVAASAEYELEKRVEKMNVFPVSIDKGDGGLGLSIIGMGVGADAGVEKLGIFVKTINPGGATDRDGRIKVNDQIIEVDNQSLVGVTQMFAASVLKNTSGTVNFLIGRENDPDNSEVAMLIRQSLMADQERDERRRALEGPNFDPRDAGGVYESFSSQSGGESPSEDGPRGSNFARDLHREQNIYGQEYGDQFGDVYNSCQSLSPRGTSSPPPEAFNHDVEGRELLLQNNEIMIMSQHLQEIQHRNEMYEEEINILRNKIGELEKELGNVSEMSKQLQEANARLKEAEDTLKSKQTEISTYQDMLEQSQGQYIILEKKYYKAKKIIKEYQSRERDFLHREEYHITQLEEKDALYNSLVKALKDRVIQLEGDLIKAQQEAGLPVKVPPDLNSQSSNFVHSSKGPDNHSSLQRDPPRKPSTLINCLDPDLSDTEAGDTHTSEGSKSSTVERKIPSKEELDVAVPPTELLDNSFSKAKGELASRGGLANRQLPSLKKSASNASSNSFDNSLDDGLDDTSSESQQQTQVASLSMISTKSSVTSISQNESVVNISHSQTSLSSFTTNSQTSTQENITFNSSRSHPPPPYHSTTPQTSTHPPSPHHQPPPYQPPPSAPLSHRPVVATDSHIGRSESSYRHPPPVARVQPVNRVEALPSPTSPSSQQQHQQTLAHQLKALLAEREGGTETPHDGNRDGSPIKKSPSSLMEDVRGAVMQADISIGKKPVISGPIHVSSTAQVVSTGQFVHSRASPQKGVGAAIPQKVSRDSGTWSPVINSSSAGGVVLLSQRPIDSSLPLSQANEVGAGLEKKSGMASSDSNSSFDTQQHQERVMSGRSSKESSIMSVFDWNKEQVAQWLVLQGLENYVSTFVNAGITGPRLVNIDTKDLKNLGLSSDDKNKIKRKVKELRQNLEKERKQIEKENKEREKLQKKAEKLAEKAERRKK